MSRLARMGILIAVALVAGCALQTAPAPEPVTIEFAVEEGEREDYQALLAAFNTEHPEITVNLQADIGAETDCFVDLPFDLQQRIEGGTLLALDPFFEQDPDFESADFYPSVVQVFESRGKTWAVPAGVDPLVLYYNKNLFDAAGMPYPLAGWTWNDFLTAGLAISQPDEGVFGYAMPQNQDAFDVALFIYQHGGRLFDDLANPTAAALDDPKTISAVEWYTDLALRHNIAPTPEQMRSFGGGPQGLGRGIYQEKFGMWLGFFSDRGGRSWPIEWPWPWGMVTLPRDQNAITAGMAPGYFLVAGRPHPEACWSWITFLSGQALPGLVPARRSIAEGKQFEGLVGSEQAESAREAVETAVLISPEVAQAAGVLEVLATAVQEVLSGKVTAEEALVSAQERVESVAP